MEFTGEIDIDQIVDEVVGSSSFDSAVGYAAENAVESLVDERLSALDIDDINDFARRAEEIATDILDGRLDEIERVTGTSDNADLTDRVAALETQLSTLTEALTSAGKLIEALVNFNAS